MPFREKIKKAFGRSPSTSDASTPGALTPVTSLTQFSQRDKKSKKDKKANGDVYKAGEAMPKPKYRAPVDPQHKDRLEAFSFAGAWEAMRRKSGQSQYSPMGSRMPSRVGSRASNKLGSSSRQQSFAVPVALEESGDPDDDVGNVGLSRHHTKEDTAEDKESGEALDKLRTVTIGEELNTSKTLTNGNGLDSPKTITNDHVHAVRDQRLPVESQVSQAEAMSN